MTPSLKNLFSEMPGGGGIYAKAQAAMPRLRAAV
jgi:hypothetical protein